VNQIGSSYVEGTNEEKDCSRFVVDLEDGRFIPQFAQHFISKVGSVGAANYVGQTTENELGVTMEDTLNYLNTDKGVEILTSFVTSQTYGHARNLELIVKGFTQKIAKEKEIPAGDTLRMTITQGVSLEGTIDDLKNYIDVRAQESGVVVETGYASSYEETTTNTDDIENTPVNSRVNEELVASS